MEGLIRISPDRERARSLVALAKLRYEKLKTYDLEKESSLIAEGYYEVAKELVTAIMFIDGLKTLSHKELIGYLGLNYKTAFPNSDIRLLDQLRIMRNNVVYYGVFVEPSYISRNKELITKLISSLFGVCESRLNQKH